MRFLINTINTKKEQIENGSFSFGDGPEVILVVGSCRVVPYLNYLSYLNAGSRFTVHFIDPLNFHYDVKDNRIDGEAVINGFERNSKMLGLLGSVKYYIHEHYQSFGMFNSSKTNEKNIYQFGLKPEFDITVPNFHDIIVLFQDFANLDKGLRAAMVSDVQSTGKLTTGLVQHIKELGLNNLAKFYHICGFSDFEEMASVFNDGWKTRRFFWNCNHVSNNFTIAIFRMLNDRYLNLPTNQPFWARVQSEDMYAYPHTPITEYDVAAYGIAYPEPVKPLALHQWQQTAIYSSTAAFVPPNVPVKPNPPTRVGNRASRTGRNKK